MKTQQKQKRKNTLLMLSKILVGGAVFLGIWSGFAGIVWHHLLPEHSSISTILQEWWQHHEITQQIVSSLQPASVYAATWDAQPVTDTKKPVDIDFANILQSILKIVYVLLRPFLWIAGLAMDNSLVYGEVFHLDKALWQFWQIARTLANFIIWFVFVRNVFKYIFDIKSGKADTSSVTKIITKLLVSSVGVNMSRWIMEVLISLSTILTVSVGWLPLNLVHQDIAAKPVLGVKTSVKINTKVSTNDNLVMLYTRDWSNFSESKTGKYLLPCLIQNNRVVWWEERRAAFRVAWTTVATAPTTPQAGETKEEAKTSVMPQTVSPDEIRDDYCVFGQDVLAQSFINNNTLIAWDPNTQGYITASRIQFVKEWCWIELNTDGTAKKDSIAQSTCTFLGNLAKKGAGQQGAFYSLYASLLGLSNIHIDTPQTTATMTIDTLLKILIALAYLVPLAILVVVLVMRVGYLWVIIAFSPLITLGIVWDILPKNDQLSKFSWKNILSLLMLPVVVTFTIALSIVMLSSLNEWFSRKGALEAVGIHQRVEAGATCYDVWITNICINTKSLNFGGGIMDYFSWIIMNLFGIGLMWFAVMAALKTSELTKEVAWKLEGLATATMKSTEFIPLPGGWAASIGSIGKTIDNIWNDIRNAPTQKLEQTTNALEWMINNIRGKDKKLEWAVASATAWLATNPTQITKWDIESFNSLVWDSSLFNGLKMHAWQIDGLLDYINALNKKMGGKTNFTSTSQIFGKEWQDFWKRLSEQAAAQGVTLNKDKIQYLYRTDGALEDDEKWENFFSWIKRAAAATAAGAATYAITNGKITKKVTTGTGNNKKEEPADLTKQDLDEFTKNYNEYQTALTQAGNDATKKEEAEETWEEWRKQNFGSTTTGNLLAAFTHTSTKVTQWGKTYKIEKDTASSGYKVVEENTTSGTTGGWTSGGSSPNTWAATPPTWWTTGSSQAGQPTITSTNNSQAVQPTNTSGTTWTGTGGTASNPQAGQPINTGTGPTPPTGGQPTNTPPPQQP